MPVGFPDEIIRDLSNLAAEIRAGRENAGKQQSRVDRADNALISARGRPRSHWIKIVIEQTELAVLGVRGEGAQYLHRPCPPLFGRDPAPADPYRQRRQLKP